MLIWLVNSYETTPSDGPDVHRPARMSLLADVLLDRGHRIVWWSSTFHHAYKRYRFNRPTTVSIDPLYEVKFVHVPPYQGNISPARIHNHRVLARGFKRLAAAEPTPDIVVASFPPVELGYQAVRYGSDRGVPVLLDVRDMWPDILVDSLPVWCRALARLGLSAMFRQARDACKDATAISGHTSAFVDWGLAMGGRLKTDLDRDFPFGYSPKAPSPEELDEARQFWRERHVGADRKIVCFFGNLGSTAQFDPVLAAARSLEGNAKILFVICGIGPQLTRLRALSADRKNIMFAGQVSGRHIWALMQMSVVAIAPIVERYDYEASIPNKAIEYLAGGLPILTSLRRGKLHDLLAERRCGFSYCASAELLAKYIVDLCSSPALRERMSMAARSLFEERFDASVVYRSMATHLEQVAADTRGVDGS
jgi:glycosyltransferase involved in cell wall biosynthesis